MSSLRAAAWLLPLLLLAAACGPDGGVCEADCPDLSGRYSIEHSQPTGQCDFVPYLVAPGITLQQAPGAPQVSIELIDPVNQVPAPLVGHVLARSERPEELGAFRLDGSATRQASDGSDALVVLDLRMTGTVLRTGGGDRLTGELTMVQVAPPEGAGCQLGLLLTGRRELEAPEAAN